MRYPPLFSFDMRDQAAQHERDSRLQQRIQLRANRPLYEPNDASHRMMANYRLLRTLKPGGMSIAVNIVEQRSTGKIHIEKQILNDHERGPTRMEAEIAALRQISRYGEQYNLNRMLQYAPGNRAMHIILEYCEGGDLQAATDRLRERTGKHSESFVWHVLLSCTKALDLLHRGPTEPSGQHNPDWNTICHLDIKPENIYLQDIGERHPRIVLGDFGGAVSNSDIQWGRADLSLAPAYTPGWEAPEMGKGYYGTKSDSWQLGCAIQAMCLLRSSPDLEALRSGRPCGNNYSRELNSVVASLTDTNLWRRQNAEEMREIYQQESIRVTPWKRNWM